MPEFAQPAWLLLIPAAAAAVALSLRGSGRSSRLVAAGSLRVAALAALAVALAGPLAGSRSGHTEVVFALDVSSSIDRETVARALELFNAARAAPVRVGLVAFGADAAPETLVGTTPDPVPEITVQVERAGTDIGRAIEAAVGSFGADAQRRIVLFSDGRENLGDARAAAAVARSLGIQIHTVALERPQVRREVYVQSLQVPGEVRTHEPFRVQAVVHATEPARAHLIVMRNGAPMHEAEVALVAGENVYTFVDQADQPGLREYEAIVNAEHDGQVENNRYQAFVQVVGAPKVLHASADAQSARYVSAALQAQGLDVHEVRASGIPATLHELLDYDLVILNNVSGFDLSLPKMELLETYVRDAGGGVVMVGGSRSYAAGGYYGTPVERLLPVDMNVKTEVEIPSLSVVFVLDRSGSMGTKVQDEDKLAIAKRAALLSIDLLNRLDRVGVLAFDSGREWVVSPTEAAMRGPIAEKLRNLEVGGGTDIHAALQEAYRVMRREQAKVKHLIVLSDGITEGEKNFDALAQQIAADGITVSTVALGSDADRAVMARIAELGKGRYYHTEDPENVPRIFTSEALTISRDLVVEADIRPRRVAAAEPLQGLAADGFPVLGGYQRTYPKALAQVLLAGPDDDPLLAAWRYGLGRTVAFTSDLSGRWGRRWVAWPEFGRFVAQTARWTMRRSSAEKLAPRFQWHGPQAEMSLDVLDRNDRFVNGLALEGTLIAPSRETRKLALEQTAPGRYRAQFRIPQPGRYYLTLSGKQGAEQIGPRTFGFAVPYSPEFLDLGVDTGLLGEIAAIGGGRLLPLALESLELMTAPAPQPPSARTAIVWPFALAALSLLLAEAAVRKLPVPDRWRRRQRRSDAAQAAAPPESTDAALQATIERNRARHLAALRAGAAPDSDDPSVQARLHVAAGRRRR